MPNYKRLTNTSVDSRNSRAVRLFCDTATALKRLKEYEDNELGPDEIKKLKEENETLVDTVNMLSPLMMENYKLKDLLKKIEQFEASLITTEASWGNGDGLLKLSYFLYSVQNVEKQKELKTLFESIGFKIKGGI